MTTTRFTPDNIDPKSVLRVKDKLPVPTCCHYCGGKVRWDNNRVIYGKSYGHYPYCYLCVDCKAYTGIHNGTDIPLGTLADRQTRKSRKGAKKLLLDVIRVRKWGRSEAYTNLAVGMGIDKSICHFGFFDAEMCRKAKIVMLVILEEEKLCTKN